MHLQFRKLDFSPPAKAKIVMHVTSSTNLYTYPELRVNTLSGLFSISIVLTVLADNWQEAKTWATWHLTDLLLLFFPVGSWLFDFLH